MYNARVNGETYPPPSGTEIGPDVRVETAESEHLSFLSEVFRIIRKRLWIIVLVAVVFVGGAAGFSLAQTPIYEGSMKLLIQKPNREASDTLNGDIQGLQQLTLTMVTLIDSRPVAESVIRELDLRTTPERLLQSLSVEQLSATPVISVSYKDPDRRLAQRVVNAVGEQFSERISEESPVAKGSVTVSVWERAALPKGPVSPDFMINIVVALLMGVLIGAGLAFLLEYLDDSWRSPEEVEEFTGLPVYGMIPSIHPSTGKKGGY